MTVLLDRACRGDRKATDELFPVVYAELRRLASGILAGERPSHTLQATALVHEAYLRLVDPAAGAWDSRAHFFGAAARAIRQILVDHARERARLKRGGGWERVTLEGVEASDATSLDLLDLDDALVKLAAMDPRMASLVELRFFAGLAVGEAAAALGISEATAARDWQLARVWLHSHLTGESGRDT